MVRSRLHIRAVILAVTLIGGASCGDDGVGVRVDAPIQDAAVPLPAMLAIDTTTSPFGSITIGTTSPGATFTISNTGGVATGALTTELQGGDAASFQLATNGCTAALIPGASCEVVVTFTPTSPGAKAATLAVAGTPGGSVTAALDGTGVALGALTVATSTSALGSVVVGQTSTITAVFTVTNTGGTATGPLAVQAAGSDPGEFTASADLCATQTLAPDATCTFSVNLTPRSRGPKSALFEITASPGGRVSGAVTGTGLAPASLVAIPLHRDFGSVVVGQTSPPLAFIVANTGDVASEVLAQTLGGGEFALAAGGTCAGAALAAGMTCTTVVEFAPTSSGTQSAQLTINGGAAGAIGVTLAGTGIAANQLAIAPSAHAFANTLVGQTATSHQFTITNNAATATGALTTALVGGDAAQFEIIAGTDLCAGNAIQPAATCTIAVTFAPSRGGPRAAALSIAGAPGGAVTAALSGLGVAPATLAIAPPSRGFGAVATGAQSAALAFTITNTGGQASGVPAVSLTGANASQFTIAGNGCTLTLAPLESCTVQVRFAPTAVAAALAGLAVSATPGGDVSAGLEGTGVTPGELLIMPSAFPFPGTTTVGDSSTVQTLTVQNTGTATTGAIAVTAAGDFSVTDDCDTLVGGATCTLGVTFTPTATGPRTGTVTASASPGGTAFAALSGTARPRLEIIALDAGPVIDPHDFGTAVINSSLPHDVLVTVRNNTAGAMPFAIAEAFGTPAQFATISNTCSATNTIAGPAGTCTVGIRFAPTTIGTKTGTVTFSIGTGAANAAAQPLTGNGSDALTITALDGATFGLVSINTTSSPLTFRVANPAGSVTTGALATSLSGSGFQIAADACAAQTLAAGASCLIDVTFSPTAIGDATTTLTASASPGGDPAIAITGTGGDPTGAVPTDIALTPGAVAENSPSGTSTGTLSTTDVDVGQTFSYALVGGAGGTDNAAFTIVGDEVRTTGTFDFEAKTSYAIRVRSSDSGGQTFEQALTVAVTNVDEAPVGVDDTATVVEDSSAIAIDVLANDTDIDAGPKTVASVTQPQHGSVSITGGGTGVTYQADADYAGPDTFTYTLNGGSLATVTITVTPVDDLPVAVDDTAFLAEDAAATAIDVLANDTDIDGGPRSVASVTQPSGGTVVITGGGTGLTYQPAANASGADSFTYTLNGGSVGTVTLTVMAVDDAPVAVNDAASVAEHSLAAPVDVLSNDTDGDGGPKLVIAVTQPANGTVTIAAGGTGVTYQPNAGYFNTPPGTAPDTFTYTITGGATASVAMTVTAVDTDLAIAISDTPDPVAADTTLVYALAVTNAGPIPATAVSVTQTLPPAVTFASATGTGWTCTHATGVVTCTRASVAVGAAPTIAVTVITPTAASTLSTTAAVTATTPDDVAANNTDTETTGVSASADLAIAITDSPDPVAAGTSLAYTLSVTNAGPSDASSVSVTATLPAGTTFTSATGTGWSCSHAAGVVVCARAALAVSTAPAIAVTVTVPAAAGSLTTTATVTAATADPASANNTDTEVTAVAASADLAMAITDSPDPVTANASLAYTLTVTNAGPSVAASLTATATLPAGVTFTSATGTGWTCAHASGVVTCTRASLAVATAPTITVAVTAPASGGSITATMAVAATTADPAPANNTDSETTAVLASADLSITLADSPDPVAAGATLAYTLAIANAGPSPAASVVVRSTLPAGSTFTSAIGAGWACSEAAGEVVCSRAALVVGPAPALTLTVIAPAAGGSISNTVSVSAATTDPVAANNTDTETTSVSAAADLAIAIAGPDTVTAGASFTYAVDVSNLGPSATSTVSVATGLPVGVTSATATGTGWSCTQTGATVTCTRAALTVGVAPTISIAVTAPTAGGTIAATTSVTTTTTDPVAANNTASKTITVTASADLSIALSESADPVTAGANFAYTLAVANAGPSVAAAVTSTATLPAGVTFVSVTGAGWTCTQAGGVVTCTRASLAVATAPITLTVTAPGSGGSITTAASVTATTADPAAANNTDSETTTVTASADLSIAISDSPDPVTAGAGLAYTLAVANAGPSAAATVTVTATLAAGTTFGTATGTGWTCSHAAGVVTCTRTALAVGAAPTLAIDVTAPADAGSLTTTTTVTTATSDPVAANNTASATTGVAASADLAITLVDSPDPATAGQNLTYALGVTNGGPSAAAAVSVITTLPGGTTFTGTTGSAWTCTSSGGTVTCSLASLAAGVAPALTITVAIDPASTGSLTASATVASATADPSAANNTASAATTVATNADLSIAIADSLDPVTAGASAAYTIDVANAGPSTASTIAVTATLPAGATAATGSGTGWSCTASSTLVTCARASLATGTAPSITISFTAPVTGGSIVTSATVTSATSDPLPANNTASETTTVTASADLAITLADSLDPVAAGDALAVLVSVTNAGPSAASAISVIATLPAGVTSATGAGTGWSCTTSSTEVTCTRSTLTVGTAPDLTVSMVAPVAGGSITTSAAVSSTIVDPAPANNSDSETTVVTASADLSLALGDSADPVTSGATFAYTVDVANAGPSTVALVTSSTKLPAGVTFVGTSGLGWTCAFDGSSMVTCTRPTLAVAAAPAITITVTAPAQGGALTATSSVSTATVDPNAANNSDTETTAVSASADLAIAIADSPDPATAGASLGYTLAVGNAGPSTATSVVVTATLAGGTTFVSASGTGWACSQATGVVTCSRASLNAGAAPDLTISVITPPSGGSLTTSATVAAATFDPAAANNSDAATTTLTTSADLSVTLSASPEPVAVGGTLAYAVLVTNTGPSAASTITAVVTLPSGIAGSGSGSGWACSSTANVVTCTAPSLASSTTAAAITVTLTAPDTASITTTTSVSSATSDPSPGNNTVARTTSVTPSADLAVSLTVSPDPVPAGELFAYSVAVTNAGPNTASSVMVSQTLPPGAAFLSALGSGWNCLFDGASTVSCMRPALAIGSAPAIAITMKALADGPLTTSVQVSSTDSDPNLSNNTDMRTIVVSPSADLWISITADLPEVMVGQDAPYTITVENLGPSPASTINVSVNVSPFAQPSSASGPGWSCVTSPQVICTRAFLDVGEMSTITMALVAPDTSITTIASVFADTFDPEFGNNNASAFTIVTP